MTAIKQVRTNSSVVVVAHDLNLSIFNPLWLTKQRALREEELDFSKCAFTPALIQIPTPDFNLLVLPDRLQLRFDPKRDDIESDLMRVLGTIVSSLPHTPYTALGINFDYVLAPIRMEFENWNRTLFGSLFSQRLAGGHDRYGAYFSTDILGFRRRVDCKPLRIRQNLAEELFSEGEEAVQISINYHADLGQQGAAPGPLEFLGKWSKVRDDASRLISSLDELSHAS